MQPTVKFHFMQQTGELFQACWCAVNNILFVCVSGKSVKSCLHAPMQQHQLLELPIGNPVCLHPGELYLQNFLHPPPVWRCRRDILGESPPGHSPSGRQNTGRAWTRKSRSLPCGTTLQEPTKEKSSFSRCRW